MRRHRGEPVVPVRVVALVAFGVGMLVALSMTSHRGVIDGGGTGGQSPSSTADGAGTDVAGAFAADHDDGESLDVLNDDVPWNFVVEEAEDDPDGFSLSPDESLNASGSSSDPDDDEEDVGLWLRRERERLRAELEAEAEEELEAKREEEELKADLRDLERRAAAVDMVLDPGAVEDLCRRVMQNEAPRDDAWAPQPTMATALQRTSVEDAEGRVYEWMAGERERACQAALRWPRAVQAGRGGPLVARLGLDQGFVLFLQHLEKTGGSSLLLMARRAEGDEAIFNGNRRRDPVHMGAYRDPGALSTRERVQAATAWPDHGRIVYGHWLFGWHQVLPPHVPYSYATMMRRPRERLYSLYRFWGQLHGPERVGDSFAHFLQDRQLFGWEHKDNYMVRAVAGGDAWKAQRVTARHLHRAFEHLSDHYDAVLLLDRYNASVQVLRFTYGWRRLRRVQERINAGPASEEDSPDAIRLALARHATLLDPLVDMDERLYAYAECLFEQRLRTMEQFARIRRKAAAENATER